jgi:hypothetical protein
MKRTLAGLAFLLAAVGLLLSLAGCVAVWVAREPVTKKATRIFERIEHALGTLDLGLTRVQSSLARAAEHLDDAQEEQKKLAREPQPKTAAKRLVARTIQQKMVPEVSAAQEKLHTVAEAAVVVNSVLEDVGNLPFLAVSGLDVDRLTALNSRLVKVGPAAWELSRRLGEPESDSDVAGAEFSQIEQALKTMQQTIAEYQSQATQVRHRTGELKFRTLAWITPASVLLSLFCLWIALSQLSLMIHARSWWRHSG